MHSSPGSRTFSAARFRSDERGDVRGGAAGVTPTRSAASRRGCEMSKSEGPPCPDLLDHVRHVGSAVAQAGAPPYRRRTCDRSVLAYPIALSPRYVAWTLRLGRARR